jgi:hypothetical protein
MGLIALALTLCEMLWIWKGGEITAEMVAVVLLGVGSLLDWRESSHHSGD